MTNILSLSHFKAGRGRERVQAGGFYMFYLSMVQPQVRELSAKQSYCLLCTDELEKEGEE